MWRRWRRRGRSRAAPATQAAACGFAGLTRASGWGGVAGPRHIALQDSQVAVIAMIEDREAVDIAGDIARVEGIDALFIGRGDLAASFGDDPQAAEKVAEISRRIAAAARKADTPLMMLPTGKADFGFASGLGATAMALSSDHGFIRTAAAAVIRDYVG